MQTDAHTKPPSEQGTPGVVGGLEELLSTDIGSDPQCAKRARIISRSLTPIENPTYI